MMVLASESNSNRHGGMQRLSDITRHGPRLMRGALLLVFVAVVGCSQFLPDVGLRDDYMGKSFLQPGKVPRPVARDETGDPDLEQRREIRIPFLPPIPF